MNALCRREVGLDFQMEYGSLLLLSTNYSCLRTSSLNLIINSREFGGGEFDFSFHPNPADFRSICDSPSCTLVSTARCYYKISEQSLVTLNNSIKFRLVAAWHCKIWQDWGTGGSG